MTDPVLSAVREHPFVEGLTPAHCETLASLGRRVSFAKDDLIFSEGDEKHEFFLLLSGRVALEMMAQVEALAFDGYTLLEKCRSDNAFGYKIMHRLLGVVSERLQAARIQVLDMYSPIAKRAGA